LGRNKQCITYLFFCKKNSFPPLKKKLVNLGMRAWAIMHRGLGFFKPNRAGPSRRGPRASELFFHFFKRELKKIMKFFYIKYYLI